MKIWRGRKPAAAPLPRAVATIGMFDGVHPGHQRLIRTTVRLARRLRATSVVVTFHPDPQQVLNAHTPPPLTSLDRRLDLIKALGADVVWVLPFTRAFSRITPEAFVREVLRDRLRAAAVVVGDTFAFGRDRRGDLRMLRELSRPHGMRVVVVPPVTRGGAAVSSSRIRALLQQGRWRRAAQLLGHPVELTGRVVRGAGRGARLGFPTANLAVGSSVAPPRGVYAVEVWVGRRRWPGVMNVGMRPTFRTASTTVCEVHLIGFRGRLYSRAIAVLLRARLRDERKFSSAQALQRQIARDVRRAGRLLAKFF
ncbi:MAG: bifunctional riboflavin kinase/FAD synthetase [Candidatus Omnitrophica bacterium]|nr:bifunctional riboflavin kinase/FAD synthetase [Candidatus Omnitrophota bacterium]